MSLLQNVRYGVRTLCKSPGFALTAILTMALGIGATTAIFGVCDAMLWKPVPIPQLDRLAMILGRQTEDPNDFDGVSAPDLADILRQTRSVDGATTWVDGLANIAGPGGEPERVTQYLVSTNFFEVVGMPPAIGRGFLAGEDEPGREREVVLSDPLWRRRYGADPSIVGRTIRLDDEDYLVTGVARPKFTFPKAADIWTPYAMKPADRANRRSTNLIAMGRLKPGAAAGQLAAELDAIGTRLAAEYPATNRVRRFMTWDAHRFMVGEYNRLYTKMLFGAVLFVLLIACVNVANLQFARATGRTREVAVRTALGASRWQIVTQLVTESVLLSLAGAVAGLAVAWWGIDLIRAGMPAEVEKYIVGWDQMGLDGRALLFTFIAAMVSGVFAGVVPAWQTSRLELTTSLKEGGRSSAGRGRHRLRNLLVAAEVALAMVLLVGASLMARGFGTLTRTATAVGPSTLLTLRLTLTETKYGEAQRRWFYREVLQRAAAIPGVQAAVGVSALPYSDHANNYLVTIEGRPDDPARPVTAMYQAATEGYLQALHIPLVAGRMPDRRDGPDAPRVAVISRRMAERYWPGEPLPLGKRIKVGAADSKRPWLTIVGVTGDIFHNTFEREPRPTLYVPYEQDPRPWLDIALRSKGDPSRFAQAITAVVRSVDPEQPVTYLRTMDTLIHNQALGLIYVAVLMGVFGGLALVLSCIGVYGVMAYMVQDQTHEIGIRMALGSSRETVLRMVLQRGLVTTLAGMAVGLVLAFAVARLLQNLVWGVPPNDAVTFIGIPLALIAASTAAIVIPARRATRIDPIIALRYE